MSPRTFARSFRAEMGTTPAAYVRRCGSRRPAGCWRPPTDRRRGGQAIGFGTVETMHRAFRRP